MVDMVIKSGCTLVKKLKKQAEIFGGGKALAQFPDEGA